MATHTWLLTPQQQMIFEPIPDADLRGYCDPMNQQNPFFDFVGNEAVVSKLNRMLFTALGRENHDMSDTNLALLSPPSTGKTSLARRLAQGASLPFVEANPKQIKNNHELFQLIARKLAEPGYTHNDGTPVDLSLRPYDDVYHYIAPPLVCFLDEAHLLPKDVQGGLLTATDKNENRLVTEEGMILNTENICWVLATTDRGRLGKALDSRFVKAYLKPYTLEQMTVIVKRQRPALPFGVCEKVALYCGRVAREALDFASEVIAERRRSGCDRSQAVEIIRSEHGIDEHGMPEVHLEVLKALAQQGPISKHALRDVANCEAEELDEYVLPVMRREGLVQTTSRGVGITPEGLAELEKQGLVPAGRQELPRDGR